MSTPALIDVPDLCAASAVMGIMRVIGSTDSPFTLESQDFKWPGEQWNVSFNPPVITNRDIAAEWIAFGVALEGKYNRFLFGDPLAKAPRGVATGVPVVDGGGQNGNTLLTKGWTAGVTGIIKKQSYIQLGTGLSSKLYMVLQDANSDGAGKAALKISPALRFPPADNAPITINNARGVFKLTSNGFSYSMAPGPQWRFSFEAVEVINAG